MRASFSVDKHYGHSGRNVHFCDIFCGGELPKPKSKVKGYVGVSLKDLQHTGKSHPKK